MGLNNIAVGIAYRSRSILRAVVPTVGKLFQLGSMPGLRTFFPWTDPAKNSMSFLPVNETLRAESVVMPEALLLDMIESASHHVVFDRCACRTAGGCEHHASEIGCLFLGESALELPGAVTRRISKEEARAHAHRAIDNGLVPLTGKIRLDNTLFSIPDRGRLVTVCFCCHCCCVMRSLKHLPPEQLDEVVVPLEGVRVEVTAECRACGECVEYCGYDAISLEDGKAVHGELCRKCGRCATHCPNQAVSVSMDGPDAKSDTIRRLEEYAKW